MICSNCGKEFKQGQVYCPNCGKIQQLVPDYFEAEEEILSDRTGEVPPVPEKAAAEKPSGTKNGRKKKRRRNELIIGLVILAVLVIIILAVRQNARSNSYDVQMAQAQSAFEKENYTSAKKHADQALTLNGSSIEARLLLYEISLATDGADLSLLEEILQLDEDNEKAYLYLIEYYAEADDYDSLLALAENAPDETLLTLFEGYLTQAPSFTPEADTYEHNTEVTIVSDDTIYYTTDGSTPTEDSDVYEEPLLLESGTWTISAIAVDAEGNRSLIASAVYVIDPEQPSAVRISPSGGTYETETQVTLQAEDGCTIYYAWDDADPLSDGKKYTGAITIPEGNHILYAVAVSEDGLSSEVTAKSFIYLPAESDADAEEAAE